MEANAQLCWRNLRYLKQLYTGDMIDLKRERRHCDLLSAFGWKGDDVGSAAAHTDRRKRVAAGTRIKSLQDAVA